MAGTAPGNNGATIDHYEVGLVQVNTLPPRVTDPGSPMFGAQNVAWVSTTSGSCVGQVAATSCEIEGLAPLEDYYVAIRAHNSAGYGGWVMAGDGGMPPRLEFTTTRTATNPPNPAPNPAPPQSSSAVVPGAQELEAPQPRQASPRFTSPRTGESVAPESSVAFRPSGPASSPPERPLLFLSGTAQTFDVDLRTPDQLAIAAENIRFNFFAGARRSILSEPGVDAIGVSVEKRTVFPMGGSGLLPGSTVRVQVPVDGSTTRELAALEVDENGEFLGEVLFADTTQQGPLPIGTRTLWVVSTDQDGNEAVMEMMIVISQGTPTPEGARQDGSVSATPPGVVSATAAGSEIPVSVSADEESKTTTFEGDDWAMAVALPGDRASVEPRDNSALVTLVQDESAEVSGSGFLSGTRADVWLFSTPTLLGTVTVDDEGNFVGAVNIDSRLIPAGNHTLQLQGIGDDGFVRAVNLGVQVDQQPPLDETESSLGFVFGLVPVAIIGVAVFVWVLAVRRRRVSR